MSKIGYFIIILIALQFCLLTTFGYSANSNKSDFNPKASIVQIYTTSQSPDYNLPWQMKSPFKSSGSGCIIANKRILTNAHVVVDHTFIQVRKAGGVDKFTAEVEYIGHESDLAVLKVKDDKFFKNTTPIGLGKLPQLRNNITVYGFPKGGDKLFITKGTISRIENGFYLHGGRHLLRIQIDATIDNGSSGGPILYKDKIVGLTFQGDKNINSGIPVTTIRHFLKDIKDGKCHGVPSLGITTQLLDNPDMRSFLKMKKEMTGVFINRVEHNSTCWNSLKKGDVLLSINNKIIANDETIKFRGDDRLLFNTEVQNFQIGETINISYLRDGLIKKQKLTLKKRSYLVPITQYDIPPIYYTFAGFVFTNLNFNYILTWGKLDDVPNTLMYNYYYGHISKKSNQIIIISKIMSDDINRGYQNLANSIVKSINGMLIKDMKNLKQEIEKTKGQYITFTLENGKHIVLEFKKAKETSPKILKRYGINFSSSKDLR